MQQLGLLTRCSLLNKQFRVNELVRYHHAMPAAAAQSSYNMYFLSKLDPNEPKFNKVLIANRGEIACRVIKSCKKMGIKTVAVYSDVDYNALHVRMADESVCIGPAPSIKSYLNVDAIVNAVKSTGAEAVHPGYGFLSENMTFAAKLASLNVEFVGPSSKSIMAMGDKIMSKRIARDAKVHIIPGFDGVIEDEKHCLKVANEIGYPVMVKASAGGGGKGMRVAWNDKECIEGFRISKAEAASSFGDDRMLVEKFIDDPRHIEIQILGDKHGNVVYLNERECSIQRRNQKVIEEAPSTFLDPATRRAMGEQAVQLAKTVGYYSAGTCEFMVDSKRNFYFLEMNTRLQVEHPITEAITGVDLVAEMLRVAKGHPLTFKQSDIGIRGWALESRVYAEDPYKNFGLPSIGRLNSYVDPQQSVPNVRCDSGIEEGSEISIYYDPMICKLVTYGPDRTSALSTMCQALDDYVIRGVTNNISLLRDICTEDNFVAGNISTNYLPKHYPNGFKGKTLSAKQKSRLHALAAAIHVKDQLISQSFQDKSGAFPEFKHSCMDLLIIDGSNHIECNVSKTDDKFSFNVKDSTESLVIEDSFALTDKVIHTKINGDEKLTMQLLAKKPNGDVIIQYLGTKYSLRVYPSSVGDKLKVMLPKKKIDLTFKIISPMPGIIKSIAVEVGQQVIEGQEICVVEAMKMQNKLNASRDGKVKKINAKVGETVEESKILVELE